MPILVPMFFVALFLAAPLFGHVSVAASKDGTGRGGFTLPDEKAAYEGLPYRGQVHYSAEDGSCGWWNNQSSKYEQPQLKYRPFDFKCLNEFHWHAYGPACGNPYYEYAKYCAMVKFYDNKKPAEWLNEKNKDMLLLLIDGCLVCNSKDQRGESVNQKTVQATITLKHTWPAGSFFTTCSEKNHTAGEIHLTLGNSSVDISEMASDDESMASEENTKTLFEAGGSHYGAFTLAAVLFQRKCRGLFSSDPMPELYQNLTLIVKHNCKGIDKEQILPLSDIGSHQFKDNWAEMRGLYINIQSQTDFKQYSYVQFKYMDLAERLDEITWFNKLEKEEDGF